MCQEHFTPKGHHHSIDEMLFFVFEMATFCPYHQSFSHLCLAYIQATVCSSLKHTMCLPGRCHLTTLSARSLLLASSCCNVKAYSAKDSAALWGSRSPVLCKKEFMVHSLYSEILPNSFTLKNDIFFFL